MMVCSANANLLEDYVRTAVRLAASRTLLHRRQQERDQDGDHSNDNE